MLKGKLPVMFYRVAGLFFCLENKVAFDEQVNRLKNSSGREIGGKFAER